LRLAKELSPHKHSRSGCEFRDAALELGVGVPGTFSVRLSIPKRYVPVHNLAFWLMCSASLLSDSELLSPASNEGRLRFRFSRVIAQFEEFRLVSLPDESVFDDRRLALAPRTLAGTGSPQEKVPQKSLITPPPSLATSSAGDDFVIRGPLLAIH